MVSEAVYVALVSGSTVVAFAVAAWLWTDERGLTARLFVAFAAVNGVTGLAVVGRLLAPDRWQAVWLYGVENGVGAVVPWLTFLFAVAYTGHRRRLSPRVLTAVLAVPVLIGAVYATNPLHGLVWSGYAVAEAPFPHVEGTVTPLSFMLVVPGMVLYYAALGALGLHLLLGSSARRRQTLVLFVAFLPPFFVTLALVGEAPIGPPNGAFVVGATWTLVLASWGVFRHELFDLAPLARETVFEVLDEMVVVIDRDRRVLDYNRAAAETFPALADREGEPVETALPQLVSGGQRVESDVAEGVGELADPGESATADVEALDPSTGEVVDVETVADSADEEVPFVDSFTRYVGEEPREYSVTVTPLVVRGSVEGHALVVRDVTERRQHVRDLEQQTAQLERLASTLSHDLRNPLNVAHGRVQIARESGDLESLEQAGDALERMEQIIEDSLTLAREGQSIDERERTNLAAVARRAWETTDTGRATLEVDPGTEVEVYTDPSRLRSAFENIFRNAVEHGTTADEASVGAETSAEAELADADPETAATADGPSAGAGVDGDADEALVRGGSDTGGSDDGRGEDDAAARGDAPVTVRVGRTDDGFYVEDDGPGVPPDQREAVFDYEFSTAEDGTGLGLAIVRAVARAHGWSVEMTGGSDCGARVVFSGVEVADGAGE